MQLKSRLPHAGTTIFTVMSSLAARHDAINLGQGFPDFPMSGDLIEAVHWAMKQGHNQYAHMHGYLPLREAISRKASALYGANPDPETEITVTPGATYALFTALTAILHPGDEVIVFEPAYDSYIPAIELNGAKAVPVLLEFPGYRIDWQQVRERITPRTRAILINNPHNPAGSVLDEEDIRHLRLLTEGTDIIIIADEVYEHLVFDSLTHHSMLRYPELFSRSYVCFSFGKTYHCTGWKTGYCIAPDMLMKEFRKVHQFNAFTCNTPVQIAFASFMQDERRYLEIHSFYQEKRDYFTSLMKQTHFDPLPSHGSYFQVYSYKRISEEPELEFAQRLTRENRVATIPVSAFYSRETNNRVLRFCFAKKKETLEEAVLRLTGL